MIRLHDVTKYAVDDVHGVRVVLHGATASLPRGDRTAILGDDTWVLTTTLQLLAGSERPDHGRITAGGLRRSPIINLAGRPGSCLAPQLTGRQNIEFFAGMGGIERDALLARVESFCRLGRYMELPVNIYTAPMRRALDVSLVLSLSYDFYLVDRFEQIEAPLVWQLLRVAQRRRAGIIFTTTRAEGAGRFGQVGAVVRDGSLEVFSRVETAIAHHRQE